MSPDYRMMDASRRTTKTLFVVAGLYVAIGLAVSASAAYSGDRLSTFLGFLIITGALVAGVMMHAILRLTVRLAGLGDRLDSVHERLQHIEKKLHDAQIPAARIPAVPVVQCIDLAAVGTGNPADITAATLERGRYPRLVTVMEGPAVQVEDAGARFVGDGAVAGSPETGSMESAPAFDEVEVLRHQALSAVTTRNLLREWRAGMHDGDLAACRRIFSALVDTTDTVTVLPLSAQLQELTDRTEQRLRAEFSAAVRGRDYAGALDIGERIRQLMPGHAVTQEFERLRPHLMRKLESEPVMVGP